MGRSKGRPKGRPLGSLLKKVLEYLPADGSEVYWKDIEEKALAAGFSARTLLRYMRLLEKGEQIAKRLDPKSGRPRYLYSRQAGEHWQRLKEERDEIFPKIEEEAQNIKAAGSYEEQRDIIAGLFSVMLPVISSSIAHWLSRYAAFDNREDADAFLDVNIEIDLLPTIKKLANALPSNPDTWEEAVQIFLKNTVWSLLREDIQDELFEKVSPQEEERNPDST